jgi:hypothetical protein
MPELIVPNVEPETQNFEATQAAVDELGLGNCRTEPHPVTGERCFIAPEGRQFVMGGAFMITMISNHIELAYAPPIFSESHEEASAYPDDTIPPTEHVGRYIQLRPSSKDTEVVLLGDPDMSIYGGLAPYQWKDASGFMHADFYDTTASELAWVIRQSIGLVSSATLGLEEKTTPQELAVIKDPTNHDELWLPLEVISPIMAARTKRPYLAHGAGARTMEHFVNLAREMQRKNRLTYAEHRREDDAEERKRILALARRRLMSTITPIVGAQATNLSATVKTSLNGEWIDEELQGYDVDF